MRRDEISDKVIGKLDRNRLWINGGRIGYKIFPNEICQTAVHTSKYGRLKEAARFFQEIDNYISAVQKMKFPLYEKTREDLIDLSLQSNPFYLYVGTEVENYNSLLNALRGKQKLMDENVTFIENLFAQCR